MVVSDAKEIVRAGLLDGARSFLRKELINDLTIAGIAEEAQYARPTACLLYTSDAADE